ncbi:nucleoid-associated protein [Puia sp.]|uniref:nucleoid-associated protein n=1 Tax=Puia sp. TaxID=2045100 RepID=UPI002F4108FE
MTVHYTGNKQNGGALLLSKEEQGLDGDLKARLTEALLSRFAHCHERYTFHHSASLEYNEVYNFVREVFRDQGAIYEQSVRIASHLFTVAEHPKIKPGELYTGFFRGIEDGETVLDAVGIFKAETKVLFADMVPGADDLDLQLKEGVELSKVDKGCLILHREEEQGFELLIFDSNGKGEEALYWKDKFLGVMIRMNEFVQTQDFLTQTKNFVTKQMPDEFEVSKTEQIDILNRSMDYFKTHGNFDREEFETEVLHHDGLIQSFRNYVEPTDSFEISTQAVKRQARVFKSVIKLDKNFHIYVHGDRELIEKGYDEAMGKHFYKIYFDHEV